MQISLKRACGSLILSGAIASGIALYFPQWRFDIQTAALICAGLAALIVSSVQLRMEKKAERVCAVLAAAVSGSMLLGYSFETTDSYGLLMKNKAALIRAATAFFAMSALIYFVFRIALRLTEALYEDQDAAEPRAVFNRVFFLVLLAYLPYAAAYFPGTNIWDTRVQIYQFFGYPTDGVIALTDHHPVFLTFLYGGLIRLGLWMGDARIGQALYSVLGLLSYAAAYAFASACLAAVETPRRVVRLASWFSALYPVYALYAINMSKDATFVPVFVVFTSLMLLVEKTDGQLLSRRSVQAVLFVLALLMMLLRKPALYVLAFSFFFFFFRYRSRRLILAGTIGGAMLCFVFYSLFLLPAWGVQPGPSTEMLSVPFQQTARYAARYPQDVKAEEWAIIDRVLDAQQLAHHYDPRLSDPVKYSARDFSGADLIAYLRVWFAQLLRHPGCYVEATLNNIYGFFYPAPSTTITCTTLNDPGVDALRLVQPAALAPARSWIYSAVNEWLRNMPVVGLFFYTGSLTWIALFLCAALSLRTGRFRSCTPFVPCLATLIICMLSPKNGEIRYLLPIVGVLPLMLAFSGQRQRKKTKTHFPS